MDVRRTQEALKQVCIGAVFVTVSACGRAPSAPSIAPTVPTTTTATTSTSWHIAGVVTEIASGRPVPGASVVASGCLKYRGEVTDSRGGYTIDASFTPACSEPVTVSVTSTGFESQTRQVPDTDMGKANFALKPIGTAVADLSGHWTLTLTASPTCAGALPVSARERVYNAQVSQLGVKLTADLSSESMVAILNPAGIWGTFIDSTIAAVIPGNTGPIVSVPFNWDYPDWVDRVGGTGVVAPYGFVDATFAGDEIRGSLNGAFEYWPDFDGTLMKGPPSAICRAPDHNLVLRHRS